MKEQNDASESVAFETLELPEPILRAVRSLGFQDATPIQALAIPRLLSGDDMIAQAQTGTGKTAAFGLPLLGRLDLTIQTPQLLVLAPTRELALQVAKALKDYGKHLDGLRVLSVYGGQGMVSQLRQLSKGVHVVVGTPGRLLDHLERGTLDLSALRALVLDEADEMLRMGFIDDVEKILEATPGTRQTALFSATMPPRIARMAKKFMNRPAEVRTHDRSTTLDTITQQYVAVSGQHRKLEALIRLLEFESIDAMIVFVRTKVATAELAEALDARGHTAFALNGDMSQQLRQKTVDRFKAGEFDILICTDVAARGLDVPRISHVLNYDIPFDSEAYVHRIGRTGRAGRHGRAILFVGRSERRRLTTIERATKQKIVRISLPTAAQMTEKRVNDFKTFLSEEMAQNDHSFFRTLLSEFREDNDVEWADIAAMLAYLVQRHRPLNVPDILIEDLDRSSRPPKARSTRSKEQAPRKQATEAPKDTPTAVRPKKLVFDGAVYRVEVGRSHGLEPKHLVGAIANEIGLDGEYIGAIRIAEDHSVVELPAGMPASVFAVLEKAWVCGVQLKLSLLGGPSKTRSSKAGTRKERLAQKGKKSRSKGKESTSRRGAGKASGRTKGAARSESSRSSKSKPKAKTKTKAKTKAKPKARGAKTADTDSEK